MPVLLLVSAGILRGMHQPLFLSSVFSGCQVNKKKPLLVSRALKNQSISEIIVFVDTIDLLEIWPLVISIN